MPASLKRTKEAMDVKPTSQDKGLVLTIQVTAYDTGMISVDGVPINASPHYDQGLGWLGAAETIMITMTEFRKQVAKRQSL